ncbi:ketopantoate reductase PanE/ApbA C terminal-domain-containing protein [Cerioporus squamosus]|nr:ketopantoate reductase PanE/ApbA C terminal-domain-containing protein [Cerioporus squamosus]
MQIHVVGLGAVGSFVAFHLRRTLAPKHSVYALHRLDTAPAISQRPHGWSVLLTSDGVTHTQDGIMHLTYHPWNYYFSGSVRFDHWDPSRRRDLELPLSRPDDSHRLHHATHPIDSLIVTTKAYAVPDVLYGLRSLISRDTTIVLLHNGMGVYEKLTQSLFRDPHDRPNFVLCTNTHGLYRKDLMHTLMMGYGEIQLGIAPDPLGRNFEAALQREQDKSPYPELSLDDIADPVNDAATASPRYLNLRNTIAALTGARALCATWRPYRDVQTAMRKKLVVNAFVNPVSALMQCKNGEVLKSPHGVWIMERLCQEAESIFKAELDATNKTRQAVYKQIMKTREDTDETMPPPVPLAYPRALTKGALQTETERIVEHTKHNYSSMHRDVNLGQRTEIEYINGYLYHLARRYKQPAFVNEMLYHLVKMRTTIPYVGKPT